MRRKIFLAIFTLFALLLACTQSYSIPTTTLEPSISTVDISATLPESDAQRNPLHRGINLGNTLESPNEGDWGMFAQEQYFDIIQAAGFDFVRIPVRWNSRADANPPYTIDPAFFARVDEVVGWAKARDLTVIIDFHHYEEMMTDPWGHKDRFLGIWFQVAEHYKDYPSNVLFELLNEPNDQLDAAQWNQYLREALGIIRITNPSREVIFGPVQWNSGDWVSTLDVPDDEHIIVTFHYYSPFEFTHQGAEWLGEESAPWLGRTWGTTEDQTILADDFDVVAEWAERKHVRILLGEFGVYHKADLAQRANWTRFIREQAEARGFAWAYWEFGSDFGAYDREADRWHEELLRALIP